MTTQAAPLLPTLATSNPTSGLDETARASRSVRKNTESSEGVRRPPADRSEVPKTDAAQSEHNSEVRTSTGERGNSFEEALQKRLRQNNDGTEAARTGNAKIDKTQTAPSDGELEQVLAGQMAVVFDTQPTASAAVKAVPVRTEPHANTHKKQGAGSIFRPHHQPAAAAQKAGASAEIRPTQKTISFSSKAAPAGEAASKTPVKADAASTNETQSAEGNAASQAVKAAPEKTAEVLSARAEQTAEPAAKNGIADTKGAASVQPADLSIPKSNPETQPGDMTPRLVQLSAKNNAAAQNNASEQETETSLKSNASDTPKLNTDKKLASAQSGDGTPAEAMDVKEQSAAAVKSVGPVESVSNAHSAAVQSSTAATQVEPARGSGDIAAARPIDQIVQTLQLRTFGPETQMRMTLAPEELGAIRVTFRQTDGEVVGLLEVQKTDTRREIERSVNQLAAAMENAGVQVRRIEVVPWNNSNSNNPRGEPYSQDFDARQHQEMYRSSDDSGGPYKNRTGFADDAGGHQAGDAAGDNRNSGANEPGLNFFI